MRIVSLKQMTHVYVKISMINIYIYILSIISTGFFVVPRSWPCFEVDKIGIRFDTNRSSRSFQRTNMSPRFVTCRFHTRHLFVDIEGP